MIRAALCRSLLGSAAILSLATGCAVGPNYVKPDVSDITPAKWKWQEAKPADVQARGEWWTVFRDSELNHLQALALQNNQELRGAFARVEQARSIIRVASAAYSPDVKINAGAQREQTSGNLPSPVPVNIPASQINTFSAPLELAYEVDVWGRIRRQVESARADANATIADYNSVILTLTGDLAAQYFLVRSYDAELAALRSTLASREKTSGFIEQRFKAGAIAEADYARARSDIASTKADIADIKRLRAETVAVVALLCGQPASSFDIKERSSASYLPTIPAGIPASLLERRPDIAAAERTVAARNADIGAQIAGYFPSISLTGKAGYLSKEVDSLFTADSKVWAIGPGITIPISSFFITKAKVARSRAQHLEAIANYRQAVLNAIKDVETSLIQIRYRREQSAAMDEALSSVRQANQLTRQRYESGALSYLELLDVERTLLSTERQAAQIKAQRQIAAVRLIKALGGAW